MSTKVLRYEENLAVPRHGGRPNKDRVMVSFYIDRVDKEAVEAIAEDTGESLSDVHRGLLKLGLKAHKRRADRAS